MKTMYFLLQKEFRQIFRNKSILPIIFAMPILQLLILPLAADYEVKNINLAVVDQDHSGTSRKMIDKLISSGYFKLAQYGSSYPLAMQSIEHDKADLILEIPLGFEKNLFREGYVKLLVAVNAINGVKAGLGGAYMSSIIRDYNTAINLEWFPGPSENQVVIEAVSSNWYNPLMNYNYYMVPGILAALVTMIGSYLTALNIVKEKEIGTIEQINVTPVKKVHFILGKLIPFWVIGMFVFTIGLGLVAYLIYGITPIGNLFLLYAFLALYLTAVLGLGLLISTFSETQQQAMSVTFFFVMIFMLMSGLFTSVESMPAWARAIAHLSPLTYFIEVMRLIVLKGSTFAELKSYFLIILGFALLLNFWAVMNYRKTS
jgi:ABC-2 type transport system permease protein